MLKSSDEQEKMQPRIYVYIYVCTLVLTSENETLEDWCDFNKHSTALF